VVRVVQIGRDHPLYAGEVELRERVLLKPIGIDIAWMEKSFPGAEERADHFVAVADHPAGERVIGCVLLVPEGDGVGKLMQMAVDPQRQREGVGKRLVTALERRAFGDRGLTKLYCHARADAADFYGGLGWEIVGEGFEEAGVPHYRMEFEVRE
jgi:N-acetylglutamate synthase-like GNAT family acetyltransferase